MTITGYCYLPTAYPSHPHATERAREIAIEGLIFLAEVGSGVHGISSGSVSDDTDYMGLTIEPPSCVTGLDTFTQFQRHTAWDRQGGLRERSGKGDCDYLVYGLKKFCRLALQGNPSILNLLFVPDSAVQASTIFSDELQDNASWFVSQQVAGRYLGYLHRQRLGMTGEKGARVKRPELVERYGFDVKYASHALRLGFQGCELLATGRITLPMPENQRERVLAVKRGEVSLPEALEQICSIERALQLIAETTHLPEKPAYDAVSAWLHDTYLRAWE